MSNRRNLNITLALIIFAIMVLFMVIAATAYEHGGHVMAPGPIGEPAKKHLV